MECCICHSIDDESGCSMVSRTPCGHAMHMRCLLQWSQRQTRQHADTSCPICRAVLVPAGHSRFISTGHRQQQQDEDDDEEEGEEVEDDDVEDEEEDEEGTAVLDLDDILSALVHTGVLEASSGSPCDQLHQAVRDGQLQAAQRILEACPAAVNARHPNDCTVPLHHAVYTRRAGMVTALLHCGANPRLQDRFGLSPLHAAVAVGPVACARKLLDSGACVECRDAHGETPLFYAVRTRDAAMVALLLRREADVNAVNALGSTVFHLLANLSDGPYPHNVAHSLLDAEPTCLGARNSIGDTALHIAAENCNCAFIRKFRKAMPFNATTTANLVGHTPRDYVDPVAASYAGIRDLFATWEEDDSGSDNSSGGRGSQI